jgi:hypothetical protein
MIPILISMEEPVFSNPDVVNGAYADEQPKKSMIEILNKSTRNTTQFHMYTLILGNEYVTHDAIDLLRNKHDCSPTIIIEVVGYSEVIRHCLGIIGQSGIKAPKIIAHLTETPDQINVSYGELTSGPVRYLLDIDASSSHIGRNVEYLRRCAHVDYDVMLCDICKMSGDRRRLDTTVGSLEKLARYCERIKLCWEPCWKSRPFESSPPVRPVSTILRIAEEVSNIGSKLGIGWVSDFSYCGAEHNNHRFITAKGNEYECLIDYYCDQSSRYKSRIRDIFSPNSDLEYRAGSRAAFDTSQYKLGEYCQEEGININNSQCNLARRRGLDHRFRTTKQVSDCSMYNECMINDICRGGCTPKYIHSLYNNIYCEGW